MGWPHRRAQGAALYWQPAPRLYGLHKPAGEERRALTDGQLRQLAAVGHVTPMTTETQGRSGRRSRDLTRLNHGDQMHRFHQLKRPDSDGSRPYDYWWAELTTARVRRANQLSAAL